MRSEVARWCTISVELVQLSTNAKLVRIDTRQQELGDDVGDASFIRTEVGREFSGIELDCFAVVFVIDVFAFATEGSWGAGREETFESFVVDGGEDECLTRARRPKADGHWFDDSESLIDTCFDAWTEIASFISVWLQLD